MLRVVPGKAANMLVPEEVTPVVGLLLVDRQRPRQAQGDGNHYRERAESEQFDQASLPQHVGQGDDDGQCPGEKALGHEPHPAGHADYRPCRQTCAADAVHGVPESDQCQVGPEGELRIEIGVTGLARDEPEAHEQQGAGELLARVVPDLAGQQIGQQHAQPGGQCRNDAHTEQVLAKDLLPQCNQPVTGSRFFEVTQPHEVRRDPVAAVEHFLADLRIAGFIGNPQTVKAQRQQISQHECQ